MKTFVLIGLLFISPMILFTQPLLFEAVERGQAGLSGELNTLVDRLKSKENVKQVYLIDIDADILHAEKIQFQINDELVTATFLKENIHRNDNYTWFGELGQSSGIFFYVNKGKLASKFSFGGSAYTLYPSALGPHLLLEYAHVDVGSCGHEGHEEDHKGPSPSSSIPHQTPKEQDQSKHNMMDDDCTLRVLVATNPAARNIIGLNGLDVPTFTQMAIDETNLVYIQSQVDITMELALLIATNYNAFNGDDHLTDVTNFRNQVNGLEVIEDAIQQYQTDIHVLIREDVVNEPFGRAFTIPTGNNNLAAADAFCTATVDGVLDARFTFAHEIGHLQGARHDNHGFNLPFYARGFVSPNGANSWRTVMATANNTACNQADGCRIGAFSNPDINGPDGNPAGANNRDNARRLEETALNNFNLRMVPNTLLLTEEAVLDEEVSNHLAHITIDTDNENIVYQAGSFGTMRCEQQILLRPGTLIEGGAEFRAYLDTDPCETPSEFRMAQEGSDERDANPQEAISLFEGLEADIYPNPTSGIIEVSIDSHMSGYQMKLFNTQGTMLFLQTSDSQSSQLDLSAFPAGLYFLTIIQGDAQIVKRIIKQ